MLRNLFLQLRLLPVFLLILSGVASAQSRSVHRVRITVSSMPESLAFYTGILGFREVERYTATGQAWESLLGQFGIHMEVAVLALGDETIELADFLTTGGRPMPAQQRSNDLHFQHIAIVVSDMDSAYALLRRHRVNHVSSGPQTIPPSNPAAAGIRAFYFEDPDQHVLEIISFPAGKGLPKWQQTNGRLFLGIDHTAIGIRETAGSLGFYRDQLGFRVAGESSNEGTEQAHLNQVDSARLHITGLRAAQGPGIEFLQYLHPGPGKPYPSDTRVDDLWFWQTHVEVDNIRSVYQRLSNSRQVQVRTRRPLPLPNRKGWLGFLVQDPDGHALFIQGPEKSE